MTKDQRPKNDKGQAHGYWEYYYNNNQLAFKCVYINGERNGFEEFYTLWEGKLREKTYYL